MAEYDLQNPLDRYPKESARANQALHEYALMGPGRSLRKLADPTRYSLGFRVNTLLRWSRNHQWQDRIARWESLRTQKEEQQWIERRQKLREDEWQVGSELLELARSMLAESPKFLKTTRRVTQDGREIITLALDSKFLIQLAEVSAKLRRMASGMETDHHRHSGVLGLEITADDLAQARNAAKKLEIELLGNDGNDE